MPRSVFRREKIILRSLLELHCYSTACEPRRDCNFEDVAPVRRTAAATISMAVKIPLQSTYGSLTSLTQAGGSETSLQVLHLGKIGQSFQPENL